MLGVTSLFTRKINSAGNSELTHVFDEENISVAEIHRSLWVTFKNDTLRRSFVF